ncbi:YgjV family protein [Methanobrevibacter sp.]|uniref:YgjV family protein n=1 Tax=Methanobrevibacter sp. TaxID=66852 RepID=UPI0038669A44
MDLPLNIVIGNGISLFAGIFIILSMWVNDEKQAYKYQFLNAFILIISSVFFFSWTGVVTMAVAASRNAMVYFDRLTFSWTMFFISVSVIFGLLVNTMGLVGVLPIIAIIQLSLCNYYLKTIKPIKISFIVNSAIYVVYFLAIWDISSASIESFTALVGLVSLARLISSESNSA